ncbi:MAG TPA: hypothetical protein VFX96_04335 [Pyrinomonadaceae bacterium]|nr:hypothetical protein [Pyrinomonadaceae bacterium]
MHGLTINTTASKSDRAELAAEVARLEDELEERGRELTALQDELREFKSRYARTVGSRLAELAEVEREIRRAESRLLGVEEEDCESAEEEEAEESAGRARTRQTFKSSMRKLFWSVAQVFHPDRAADEDEARRRHSIMAEASRAYNEGDAESLEALLGDEALRSHCAVAREDREDLTGRLSHLREELLTVEFGLKRTRQDSLFQLMRKVEEEARAGRDALAVESQRIERLIVKARRRLEHLV